MSAGKFHSAMRKIPKERRSHLQLGGSLKSRTVNMLESDMWYASFISQTRSTCSTRTQGD